MAYIESKKKRKYPGLKEAEKQRRITTNRDEYTTYEQEDLSHMTYDEYQRWLILNNID